MIFVTGGTGLLGNCIVRELLSRGVPVRALCRSGTDREPFEGLDLEIVEGDLSDTQTLMDASAGCQAVIHSAAMIHIGWQRLEDSRGVNVQGTQHILDACQHTGARLVFISTVDTLPAAKDRMHPIDETAEGGVAKTPCSYVLSKTEAEQAVRQRLESSAALDATIVHPGFMLGPYDWKPSSGRMMLEVHKAPVVAAPPGGCSFCDARDVAHAIANAVDRAPRGENYILAGENWSYQQLWREMLATTGRRRRVFRMGGLVRHVGGLIDVANRWLPIHEGDVNGAAIAMGSLNHYYSSQKAEQALGYVRRAPEVTLKDAWEWLSARF